VYAWYGDLIAVKMNIITEKTIAYKCFESPSFVLSEKEPTFYSETK